MPSYVEIKVYFLGLWLLIKGDPKGFQLLDISDRGMMRSFWAFVWCLPAAVISWFWWRSIFLEGMPVETKLGGIFFVRLAMLEVLNWMLPLILAGIFCAVMGLGKKFPAIVVTSNWLSVPFSYAYGILSLGFLLPASSLDGFLALLRVLLLLAMVISISRLMRAICGPQPLLITGLVLVLIVPTMILSELLQRFLGIYPF